MAEEKKVPAKGAKKGNFWVRKFGAIGKFFRDTKSELKKVVYPTPKQMVNNTLVVLLCVLVVGVCRLGARCRWRLGCQGQSYRWCRGNALWPKVQSGMWSTPIPGMRTQ